MHADRDFDRDLELLVHEVLDRESGPHPVWADAPASRTVAALGRRRVPRLPWKALAVAAVLVVGGTAVAGLIVGGRAELVRREAGWIAFARADQAGIYLVREGEAPRQVTGPAADGIVQACPTFSADGRRIAYAEATGNAANGYRDVSMVIADLTPDGVVTGSTTWALDGLTEIPCGTWSSDGHWIALGVYHGTQGPTEAETTTLRGMGASDGFAEEIWIVDTTRQAVKRIEGFEATDLEWEPDGDRLAIANDWITMYNAAQDGFEPVGPKVGMQRLSWSPDGKRLAYDRTVEIAGADTRLGHELWTVGADGTDATLIAEPYDVNHGIGPVWSPDGKTIAYQRICTSYPTDAGPGSPCREEHEVVIVPVGPDGHGVANSAPAVIPPPRTDGPAGPRWWYPWSVTWSPDGSQLLYTAWSSPSPESGTGLIAVAVVGDAPAVTLDEGPVDALAPGAWSRIAGD